MKRLAYVLLFLAPMVAAALVLPPSYVLDQWGDMIGKTKTLHVKLETTLSDSTVAQEEIWIRKPSHFRRSFSKSGEKTEWLVTPTKSYRYSYGRLDTVAASEALGAIGMYYLPENTRQLNSFLRQAGVDFDTFRWDLVDKRTVWEVGKPEGPKATLIKEDWVPHSLLMNSKNYVLSIQIPSRFPVLFPEVVEVFSGKNRTEQTRTLSVQANAPISDATFDINAIRGLPTAPTRKK